MCNFIKANGECCKLSPKKDACHKHNDLVVEKNDETNIVKMSPQIQTTTPVIHEDAPIKAPVVVEAKVVVEVAPKEISKKYFELMNMLSDDWFGDSWHKPIFAFRNAASDGLLEEDIAHHTGKQIVLARASSVTETEIDNMLHCQMKYTDKRTKLAQFEKLLRFKQPEKYNTWKNKYATSQGEVNKSLNKSFDETFCSTRCNNEIKQLLSSMGQTFKDFEEALCDSSFKEGIELAHWADHYCTISNTIGKDFDRDYRSFERLLKTIVFDRREMATRFIMYFIHEFYIFSTSSSKTCYIRSKPTKNDGRYIRDYDIGDFKHITVRISSSEKTVTLAGMLAEIPYHKFDSFCFEWDHDPTDLSSFSMAIPVVANVLDYKVSEDDLLSEWLYYVKVILCDSDEEKWIWFRSYLANIIHQPNERTEVMVLLYSMETRLGKSTLHDWLRLMVFGESNTGKVENMGQAVGERGAPHLIGKRLTWFEELTDCKKTFRACMDRLKTAITDSTQTSRKLYREVQEYNSTTEFIAATNHLVGVLENRMTVFKVCADRQNDRVFYTKLRKELQGIETDKIVTYLKDFVTPLPMRIHETKEYTSMLNNSSESIVTFIRDLKDGDVAVYSENRLNRFVFVLKTTLYSAYTAWCDTNKEQMLSFNRFKEKLIHYSPDVSFKRIKYEGMLAPAFIFPTNYLTSSNSDGADSESGDISDEEYYTDDD